MTTQYNAKYVIPTHYSELSGNQFETGKNISGLDLTKMALNANYLVGNGNCTHPISFASSLLTPNALTYRFPRLELMKTNTLTETNLFVLTGSTSQQTYYVSMSLNGSSSFSRQAVYPSLTYLSVETDKPYNGAQTPSVKLYYNGIKIITSGADTSDKEIVSLSAFDSPMSSMDINQNDIYGESFYSNNVISNRPGTPLFSTSASQNASLAGILNSQTKYHDYIKQGKCLYAYSMPYLSVDSVGTETLLVDFLKYNIFYNNQAANLNWNEFQDQLTCPKPLVYATQDSTTTGKVVDVYFLWGAQGNNIGQFEVTSAFASSSVEFGTGTGTAYGIGSMSLRIETEDVFSNGIYGGLPYQLNNTEGNITFRLAKAAASDAQTVAVYGIFIIET